MSSLAMSVVLQAAVLGASDQEFVAALDRAAQDGRPLVVLLGADWCPGCRIMKGKVLPQVAKAGGLRGVQYVYVDVDRRQELANKLSRSDSIPQLLCFVPTPSGWRSDLLVGAQSARRVQEFIDAGVARMASARRPAARPTNWDQALADQLER